MTRLIAVLFLGFVAAVPLQAAVAARAVPASAEEVRLSYAPLVKRTAPAVVNIYTRRTVKQRRVSPLFDDPFFRRFFGDRGPGGTRERVQNSLGSGVIVAANGLIVTNYHVIEGADEIRVVLADRREFDAELVMTEERNDLALLQVDARDATLPVLGFGDSDQLEVGDLILAIGNPFRVGQTVTSGIVSATARTSRAIGDGGVFIQTDAAINPGNSGGALVDLHGNLVGVNTAIFSRSGGSHGIGFAIPVNLVKGLVAAHQAGGETIRPWLGAEGESVRQDIAQALGLERPRGIILSAVYPDGPFERAGLRKNDVILKAEGETVDDMVALRYRLETADGDRAQVTYWRRGETATASVPLEAPPENPPRNETVLQGRTPFNGVRVINVSPAVVEEFGLTGVADGVLVTGVRRESIGRRLGFRTGDVIEEVNGRSVSLVRELVQLEQDEPESWQIILRRGGKRLRMEFRS